jgi:hypothetical protein
MKQLLPLALFGAILLAGCDATTTQAGTSSETQTSLQELANRLVGLPLTTSSQGSARKMASTQDTAFWPDLWSKWILDTYQGYSDRPSVVHLDSNTNFFYTTSAYTQFEMGSYSNGSMRGAGGNKWDVQSCGDSSLPPPHCRAGISGHPQLTWGYRQFRNGAILSSPDSSGDQNAYLLDGRWLLRSNPTTASLPSWDVFENGRLIGHAQQDTGGWSWSYFDDGYANSLVSMTIYNLAGQVVHPDVAQLSKWMPFPEDSLGLFVDSITPDTLNRILIVGFSWRFVPNLGIPKDSFPMLSLGVCDSLRRDTVSENNTVSFTRPNPIQSPQGRAIARLPLDSIHVRYPTTFFMSLNNEVEFNVGARSQTRYDFSASTSARYPASP